MWWQCKRHGGDLRFEIKPGVRSVGFSDIVPITLLNVLHHTGQGAGRAQVIGSWEFLGEIPGKVLHDIADMLENVADNPAARRNEDGIEDDER